MYNISFLCKQIKRESDRESLRGIFGDAQIADMELNFDGFRPKFSTTVSNVSKVYDKIVIIEALGAIAEDMIYDIGLM